METNSFLEDLCADIVMQDNALLRILLLVLNVCVTN